MQHNIQRGGDHAESTVEAGQSRNVGELAQRLDGVGPTVQGAKNLFESQFLPRLRKAPFQFMRCSG